MRISDWSADVCSSDLTNLWGVGDIFGVIGSSTPERWFTDGAGNSPDPLMREYDGGWLAASTTGIAAVTFANQVIADRSEERRVGKECVSTCRSRRSPSQ